MCTTFEEESKGQSNRELHADFLSLFESAPVLTLGPEIGSAIKRRNATDVQVPHAVGRCSFAHTPRIVGGCGFESWYPPPSSRVARGTGALSPIENQPTVHRARTVRCVLGAVVCAANSRRAPLHAVGRGSWHRPALCRWLRLRTVVDASF